MAKLKILDQYLVQHKNKESGYTLTEVVCPGCKGQFKLRNFAEHIQTVHSRRKDEIWAMALGLTYPVHCTGCGKELKYDDNLKIYPTKCPGCQGVDQKLDGKSSDEIEAEIRQAKEMFDAKMEQLKQAKANAEKVEKFRKIDLKELKPKLNNEARTWIRKIVYEMRPLVANGNTNKIFELLNYMDQYVE